MYFRELQFAAWNAQDAATLRGLSLGLIATLERAVSGVEQCPFCTRACYPACCSPCIASVAAFASRARRAISS